MSHQETGAPRGWLPTLGVDERFRTRTATIETLPAPETNPGSESGARRVSSANWSAALENQFGLRTSPQDVDVPVEARVTPEAYAELQDRLAWYENFDGLIRDNVARSAALFQAIFEERDKAKRTLTDSEALISGVAAEAERQISAQRQEMQNILISLMDEAQFLQQRSDALVQRVAEAITQMTAFRDEEDEPVSGA